MNQAQASSKPTAASRKKTRLLCVFGAVLVVMLLLPWILAKTALRDQLLTAIVNSDDVRVQSQDASFGYFTPLSLAGLRIESRDQTALIKVQRIEADHSWLGLLLSRPQLGTFRFDQPSIDVRIEEGNRRPAENAEVVSESPDADVKVDASQLPELAAEIRDASVVVRTSESAQPPIDIDEIDLTFRLQRQQDQSVLSMDPTTVFDHQPITPQLCGHGLQLIAPLLADEIDAEGEFSLRFREFQVPLGGSEAPSTIRVDGELELHRASVSLKNTIATNIIGVVTELIGDVLPEKMTVAKGVNVQFQVVDGRIHHQGLALLLPRGESSITIVSNGSVGLDESLDLQVSIGLPKGLLGETTLAKQLIDEPMVIGIGGTLDEPKIGLPKSAGWIQSIEGLISGKHDGPSDDSLEQAVTDIVGGLLDRAREPRGQQASEDGQPTTRQPLFPGLRDRLRDRMRRRKESPKSGNEPAPNREDAAVPTDI